MMGAPPPSIWIRICLSESVYSRCCIRIRSAMVGIPHRPLLPALPTCGAKGDQPEWSKDSAFE